MKYCENCGAKLEDDACFCDECGAKVEENKNSEQKEIGTKKGNKKWGFVIAVIAVLLLGVGVFFALQKGKENQIARENQTTLERIKWKEHKKKIEKLKKESLKEYPGDPIGEVMDQYDPDIKWLYGKEKGIQYLQCISASEGKEEISIFKKEKKEPMEMMEYYENGERLTDDFPQIYKEFLFEENYFSVNKKGFFTNGKWGMEIKNVNSKKRTIEYYPYWWNFETSTMEQASEELQTISILNRRTMGNEEIAIKWSGNDSFILNKHDCQILFQDQDAENKLEKQEEFWESGMGEFKKEKKPEKIKVSKENIAETQMNLSDSKEDVKPEEDVSEEENERIFLNQTPIEGTYWQGDKPPYYAQYYIEVSNGTDDSFDFEIYQAQTISEDGGASDYKLVFNHHTAVFTDAFHAVYEGENYTLKFLCGREAGYLTLISGFSEVIPDGSELYNTEWLGVS